MRELDVEELLTYHPYLISEKFAKFKPLRQLTKRNYRLDMAFQTKQGLSIVELKKERLKPEHVSQLLNYCRAWETPSNPLASEHFLIGKAPQDPESLQNALRRTKRSIRVLILGKDIPRTLMLIGDRYHAYDETRYSNNIIEIKI